MSNFALGQPAVVAKSRDLEADRPLYAAVRQRMVAKGRLDAAHAEKSEVGAIQFALYLTYFKADR